MPDLHIKTSPTSDPILSIVLTGRDDDYMLDFRYRATTTINFIASHLAQIGRLHDVEIVFTDWGSETPLAETLELTTEGATITRFVTLTPDDVRDLQNGSDKFHVTLSLNIGLRRCRGRFLMFSAADTIYTGPALDSLLRFLEGTIPVPINVEETFFLCRRRQVPWKFVQQQPSLEEWSRCLLLHAGEFKIDESTFGVTAGAGALLLSRKLWEQTRGLDERLPDWGWNDIELGHRIGRHYPWLDLSYMNVCSFHMEHHPTEGLRAETVGSCNHSMYGESLAANDENWGLPDRKFPIEFSRRTSFSKKDAATDPKQPTSGVSTDIRKLRDQIVREISDLTLCSELPDIFRYLRKGGVLKAADSDGIAVALLCWYAKNRNIRKYIEIGAGQGFMGVAVGAIAPTVELYGVDDWRHVSQKTDPVLAAWYLRSETKHQGYLRFVNGDPNTAIDRLKNSFIGEFSFDLAFIREASYYDTATLLKQTLQHLNEGGALVLKAETADSFAVLWASLRRLSPNLAYFPSLCGNIGLILNVPVENPPGEEPLCLSSDVLNRLNKVVSKAKIPIPKRVWRELKRVVKRPFRRRRAA